MSKTPITDAFADLRAEIDRLTAEHRAEIDAERAEADLAVADLRAEVERLTADHRADAERSGMWGRTAARQSVRIATLEAERTRLIGAILATGRIVDCYGPVSPEVDHDPSAWGLYAERVTDVVASQIDKIRARASKRIAALEAELAEASQPALSVPPGTLHPDGCHSTDATATRNCTSDGHHECVSCTRFDAAGRAAMGDDPIGGPRGPLPKGG